MIFALQTFTIRKQAKHHLQDALKLIKAIGIENLELSRFKFDQPTAKIITEMGFNVVAVQLKYKVLLHHFDEVTRFCMWVHCPLVEVSVLPIRSILGGKKELLKFAVALDQLAEKYHAVGLELAFHHHHFEFTRLEGVTRLDWLLRNTSDQVKIVSDTYWATRSGVRPDELLEKINHRLAGIHLRDFTMMQKGIKIKACDTELGEGSVDIRKVLAVAERYARYAAIEQKTKTPFKSIEKSMAYLNRLAVEEKTNERS